MCALSSAVPLPLGAVHWKSWIQSAAGSSRRFCVDGMMSAVHHIRSVLCLSDNELGFKMKTILPAHAQMAAESLIHSLEDKGKLGTLTRPLTLKHLQTCRHAGETPTPVKPRETWLTCSAQLSLS